MDEGYLETTKERYNFMSLDTANASLCVHELSKVTDDQKIDYDYIKKAVTSPILSSIIGHDVRPVYCVERIILNRMVVDYGGEKKFMHSCNLPDDKEDFKTELISIIKKLYPQYKGKFASFFQTDIVEAKKFYSNHSKKSKVWLKDFERVHGFAIRKINKL